MSEDKRLVVLVTTQDLDSANVIAGELIEQRKAACVNIIREVNSLFRWEGKVDAEQEALLVVKTRSSALPGLIGLIKRLHSYDVPEVIALPIVDGLGDYLEWLDTEVVPG